MQIITNNFKVNSNKDPIIISFSNPKEKINFFSSLVKNKEACLLILFPNNKKWDETKRKKWLKEITGKDHVEYNKEDDSYIVKKGDDKE